MRQCKCGGLIREHQLTGNRVAWTCNECGRYEQVETKCLNQDLIDFGKHIHQAHEKVGKSNVWKNGQNTSVNILPTR